MTHSLHGRWPWGRLVVLLACWLGLTAQSPILTVQSDLWADTGPFSCVDGNNPVRTRPNTSTMTLRVSSIEVWYGMDMGAVADLSATILLRDGPLTTVLYRNNWDHYQNPTGPHSVTRSFAPGALSVPPGAVLEFRAHCEGFGTPWHAHVWFLLVYWWE